MTPVDWDLGGPSAAIVDDVLSRLTYRPGWSFRREGSALLTTVQTINSLDGEPATFTHGTQIPMALMEAMGEEGVKRAERWAFDEVCRIELHEAAEHFQLDGAMPFFPHRPDGSVRSFEEAHRDEPVKPREPASDGEIEVYYERRMRIKPGPTPGYC